MHAILVITIEACRCSILNCTHPNSKIRQKLTLYSLSVCVLNHHESFQVKHQVTPEQMKHELKIGLDLNPFC